MTAPEKNLIKAVLLSLFDEDGPTPKFFWPNSMEESARLLVAMKTISLLMGDAVYQNGTQIEGVNYFGILPFPDLDMNALTYFFLIPDPKARGSATAATITVLIDEDNKVFFYENMKYLRVIIDKAAVKIQESGDMEEKSKIMEDLKDELFDFAEDIKDPLSAKRRLKILFVGLDKAGKTSFLLGVKKKYSEIIKTLPTKGVSRTEEKVYEEQNSIVSIWDLGGQQKYREKYFEQSKLYLYNVDLLFYFIDIQDTKRLEESVNLYKKVLNTLKDLDESPPIVVCLNKFDPDLKKSKKIKKTIKYLEKEIIDNSINFLLKIFHTSIFDNWSLISAYSFGLSQLSPNRELFENQLKFLAKKTKSEAILLLNDNGIILSSFSRSNISGKVFEISAPHFQTLYKTFKEFKLLKQDFIISTGMTEEGKKILFKKINIDKYRLYLLLFLGSQEGIKKIEKTLPKFSKNIKQLIQTYI